jgi:predicted nuclease of predicted toxin-antitoxin system
MKFLCDVHIPMHLVHFFRHHGHECMHVSSLSHGLTATDTEIAEYADTNGYVLISKDHDFKNSFFLQNSPKKLICVRLGNISNTSLTEVFRRHLLSIRALEQMPSFMVEVFADTMILFQ